MAEAIDVRDEVFCCREIEVFHSVVHASQIEHEDPFDVDEIHADARCAFDRLVERVGADEASRILLFEGASGAGKTHLMRAFRNRAHGEQRACVAYMQLTSNAPDYAGYILRNVISSLAQRYHERTTPESTLLRASDHLAEDPAIPAEARRKLREDELGARELGELVVDLGDKLVSSGRYHDPFEVLPAVLLLQRREPPVTNRVFKYLSGARLSEHDQTRLGGLAPLDREEPIAVLSAVAGLLHATEGVPLAICFDQLEDMYSQTAGPEHFREAMKAICSIQMRVPSTALVIACLEDYYELLRQHLTRPYLDRIEKDPDPVRLSDRREPEEVRALIRQRLDYLYEAHELALDEEEPLYPFPAGVGEELAGRTTREVLEACRRYRQRCIEANQVLAWSGETPETPAAGDESAEPRPAPEGAADAELERAWNDYLNQFDPPVLDEDGDQAELIAWALHEAGEELETGHAVSARTRQGKPIAVEAEVALGGESAHRALIGLANRGLRGGGLGNQLEAIAAAAEKAARRPVAARASAFPAPRTRNARIHEQTASFLQAGGRRVSVEAGEWKQILAFRAFLREHAQAYDAERFRAWRRREQPLRGLAALREMLELDALRAPEEPPAERAAARASRAAPEPSEAEGAAAAAEPAPEAAPGAAASGARAEAPAAGPQPDRAIPVGTEAGVRGERVALEPALLTRHAGVLGNTGSGKTVLACGLIERLLERGIPAILIDRKGDLCSYADPEAWAQPLADEAAGARRDALRRAIAVSVYTPGHPPGRPLRIPVCPPGLAALAPTERESQARHAATALASMTSQGPGRSSHDQFVAILTRAILLLAETAHETDAAHDAGAGPALETLIEMVADQDPALVSELAHFDARLFKKLATELETLRINRSHLLAGAGEELDPARLFARANGKTPLTVISTKFLGDAQSQLFWVSQFLMEVGRYAARNPSEELQGVLLFDEADQYLPAVQKPATKGPMENLLKRGRSAGLGLMLATQNPGDLDYRCADQISSFFLGKITQKRALEKVRAVLGDADEQQLAKQDVGEFHFAQDARVRRVRAEPSLVRPQQLSDERIEALTASPESGSEPSDGERSSP